MTWGKRRSPTAACAPVLVAQSLIVGPPTDDMVTFLQQMISLQNGTFTTEERNLLSVGFKNQIGNQRTAIRTIGAVESNPEYEKFNGSLQAYKSKIQQELFDKCMGIVDITTK